MTFFEPHIQDLRTYLRRHGAVQLLIRRPVLLLSEIQNTPDTLGADQIFARQQITHRILRILARFFVPNFQFLQLFIRQKTHTIIMPNRFHFLLTLYAKRKRLLHLLHQLLIHLFIFIHLNIQMLSISIALLNSARPNFFVRFTVFHFLKKRNIFTTMTMTMTLIFCFLKMLDSNFPEIDAAYQRQRGNMTWPEFEWVYIGFIQQRTYPLK